MGRARAPTKAFPVQARKASTVVCLAAQRVSGPMANLPPQLSRALGDAAASVEQFAELAPGIPRKRTRALDDYVE